MGAHGALQIGFNFPQVFGVIGAHSPSIRTFDESPLFFGDEEYFRLYADRPWAQAWWALTYYNAWLMTVNDDPFVWFYYNYGFTTFIPMVGLWVFLKLPAGQPAADAAWAPA